MNVMYTCDDNYVWLMGISTLSLFENNKSNSEINVYLLGNNISEENKNKLNEMAVRYQQRIIIIDVFNIDIPDELCDKRWPKSAYTRLYAGDILPEDIDKIIYMDCDTIVNNDLSELWNFDMRNNVVAGVRDCISKEYNVNLGLDKNEIYLNAGMLLLNIASMRKMNMSAKIKHFLKNRNGKILYADQDMMNVIFAGKKDYVDIRYNVMSLIANYSYKDIMRIRRVKNYYSREKIDYARENPYIIHYTTCMLNLRPWYKGSKHPYCNKFLKYMKESPWQDHELLTARLNTKKDMVFKILNVIPKGISYNILGYIHSYIRPVFYRIKNRLKGSKKK